MKISLIVICLCVISSYPTFSQTVTDAEGNVYATVTIGNQVWMAENLRATQFSNLEPIPFISDNTLWSTQTQAAYCYYQNDALVANEYAHLYNWQVASDARNVCPTNYHVPTLSEWETLITFLGGNALAGGQLKEVGFVHWLEPNTGASNSSGFTLLPSGWRAYNNGFFENLNYMAYLWSSTPVDALNATIMLVGYDSESAYTSSSHMNTGLPIRCIRDETSSTMDKGDQWPSIIYPNPAMDFVKIQCPTNAFHTVALVDVYGKTLIQGMMLNGELQFDVSNIPSGAYFINFKGGSAPAQEKIIIQH
jgi:uncharacterized protein (TIGR02145 family)